MDPERIDFGDADDELEYKLTFVQDFEKQTEANTVTKATTRTKSNLSDFRLSSLGGSIMNPLGSFVHPQFPFEAEPTMGSLLKQETQEERKERERMKNLLIQSMTAEKEKEQEDVLSIQSSENN